MMESSCGRLMTFERRKEAMDGVTMSLLHPFLHQQTWLQDVCKGVPEWRWDGKGYSPQLLLCGDEGSF